MSRASPVRSGLLFNRNIISNAGRVTMNQIHKKQQRNHVGWLCVALAGLLMMMLGGCATSGDVFRDSTMDFGAVRTVGIMPFVNLSRDQLAAERVRDVFSTALVSTGSIYTLPTGEVARAIN